jgi:hypothetical protein
MMNDREKSHSAIVAAKPTNNASVRNADVAEPAEPTFRATFRWGYSARRGDCLATTPPATPKASSGAFAARHLHYLLGVMGEMFQRL